MAMITANIGVNGATPWIAPSDCIVNINGRTGGDYGGSLIIDNVSIIVVDRYNSVMFSITGEPIKGGQIVSIINGQARIAGFTV